MSGSDHPTLTELEQHLLGYYLANAAQDLAMAGRFWPKGDLVLIIQDKIEIAARKFGRKVTATAATVARAFLDALLEREAFSTVKQEYGGTMHQFQPKAYQAAVQELRASNAILAAAAGDPDYWPGAFARLTDR
jgi:hypothetical protein